MVGGTALGVAEFPVAGIGASAGGISALRTLFEHIPASPRLAFVVVQHLLPDQPSQLTALLGRWAALPVIDAADGVKLEPDHIYVAPPDRVLALEDDVFVLHCISREGPRPGIDTIDAFFESMARDLGRRAVAVVLSGTGADGAAGAVRVKQAGGMVLIQDPTTAMHDGMPRAAIANGGADHILPLPSLAQELAACAAPGYVRCASAPSWASDVSEALDGIMDLVQRETGVDLSAYKAAPLLWRIQRRMELRRVSLFSDYEALLHDDRAELEGLIRDIPIHVTEFFRDAVAWDFLQREVIGPLFTELPHGKVRAWTPACSTGEEAYSLAILLAEEAQRRGRPDDFQVFATDASAEILARASRGFFRNPRAGSLSAERRQRFFYAADGGLRVQRSLREKMVFAPQDLISDPPFSGLDLVTCRNLLIYLEPEAARRVIYLLHSSLRLGGCLLLGKGESLPTRQHGFEELTPQAHVYRKVGPATKDDVAFPTRPRRLRASGSMPRALDAYAQEMLVAQQQIPAVMVDEHFAIIRLYGDTARLLSFAPGEPTLDLLALLPATMAGPLGFGLRQALAEQRVVTLDGFADPVSGELTLGLRVTPLEPSASGAARLLVAFLGRGSGEARALAWDTPRRGDARSFSEALRLSHEELEASREELQALNQELQASNDQLNLANEDLAAANAQLLGKIEELETQSNVLSSGAVMTLFLDGELRVRWFTPAIRELFPLRPSDVGRAVTDFVQRFEDARFIADVHAVMDAQQPGEVEVRNLEGRLFLRRISPYLVAGETAAGVAVTFTDITERARAEQALRENEAVLAHELENARRLQELGSLLLEDELGEGLFEQVMDTASAIMRADFCSIQVLDPASGALKLVAWRNFHPDSAAFWDVVADSGSICGAAFQRGGRVVITDVREAGSAASAETLAQFELSGIAAVQSTPMSTTRGSVIGMISTHWRAPHVPKKSELLLFDILVHQVADFLERRRVTDALRASELRLREKEVWLAAQKDAFQSAMNGAGLPASLGILVQALVDHALGERRGAFYLVDPDGQHLRHVVGAPDACTGCVDGPESLAHGLALTPGEPARDPAARGCWSFPVETSAGKLVGVFALHFRQPRALTAGDRELAAMLTHTAAIVIAHHQLAVGGP